MCANRQRTVNYEGLNKTTFAVSKANIYHNHVTELRNPMTLTINFLDGRQKEVQVDGLGEALKTLSMNDYSSFMLIGVRI